MSFPRNAAYRNVIGALADVIASMDIAKLAPFSVGGEVADDLRWELQRRHRSFDEALFEASCAHDEQQQAERRKAGAIKAAATRAKRTKARAA